MTRKGRRNRRKGPPQRRQSPKPKPLLRNVPPKRCLFLYNTVVLYIKLPVQVDEAEESGEDFSKELGDIPADSDEEEEEPKPKKAPTKKAASSKKDGAATKKTASKKKKVCTTLVPDPAHQSLVFHLDQDEDVEMANGTAEEEAEDSAGKKRKVGFMLTEGQTHDVDHSFNSAHPQSPARSLRQRSLGLLQKPRKARRLSKMTKRTKQASSICFPLSTVWRFLSAISL